MTNPVYTVKIICVIIISDVYLIMCAKFQLGISEYSHPTKENILLTSATSISQSSVPKCLRYFRRTHNRNANAMYDIMIRAILRFVVM